MPDPNQYLDNRQMQSAQVHGTPMSAEAKHRAVIQKQVFDLRERASTMSMSVAQYVNLQDTGQIQTQAHLPVPDEFRQYLLREQTEQQHAIQRVQRQPPTQSQDPMYQQAQQAMMSPPVVPTTDQRIAPPPQQVYDQVVSSQIAQMVGPDPTADELASLDAMMGAAPDMGIADEGYDAAIQHLRQNPPPPMQVDELPSTINVEQMPPGIPPVAMPKKPSSVTQLQHPMWRQTDNLILWESFCACLLEADSHLVREPSGRGKAELTARLSRFQKACDLHGEKYLKEIEKRARHRAMLTRRLTVLGVNPITITRLAKDYQSLLGPITYNEAPEQGDLDRALEHIEESTNDE